MEMLPYFKSILEEDHCAVVICGPDHQILYMNPAACKNYTKYGGAELLEKNLLDCHNSRSKEMINKILEWFKADKSNNRVHTFYNEKQHKDGYMIALRDEQGELIGYYEKHEFRDRDLSPFYQINEP